MERTRIIIETPYHLTMFITFLNTAVNNVLTPEEKSDITDITFRVINGIAINVEDNVIHSLLNEILTMDRFLGFDIESNAGILVSLVDNLTTEMFTMLNELDLLGKTINVLSYTENNLRLEIY